ncbi:MAG: primary-amine oxidase [Jatrophihabitantaceae bacterium]
MSAGAAHPLDPVVPDEIRRVRRALVAAGLLADRTRLVYCGLVEPAKDDVLAHRPGDPVERSFRALLLELDSGHSRDVLVSATHERVERVRVLDPAVDGQLPLSQYEMDLVESVLAADPRWQAALARRGLDAAGVRVAPLSAGSFEAGGRRLIRALGFHQESKQDHPWAHPVDGLVAQVDLTRREVHEVRDHRVHPVPQEPGNFGTADVGRLRTSLRPISITQPQGPSFTVEGGELSWQGWTLRLRFDAREGLTMHQIAIDGRPIVYRASIAEMVVPYGDPTPSHYWQNYFDAGEYLFGRFANSLELGCDCLGEIHYLDAVLADEMGEPFVIRNAVCLHEEDFGVLWKHTDTFTGSRETRRQRRLVISFFTTVGNYDYGFYWYLYLDGTIECEVKATGIVFTSAYPPEGSAYSSELAPGLGAPHHQHLFCARLDMTVDGTGNAVDEVDILAAEPGPDNPHGNAITTRRTRLTSEAGAQRMADASAGRTWHVVNPTMPNRLGHPVAYALYPQQQPTLLAGASSIRERAAFATRHLWVTRYDRDERYPAGDFVNQHKGGAGLPVYAAADRDLDGADLVLWHTFGLTHVPRTEDWPIMPVDRTGFSLRPVGFFDRNPTLDVPPSANAHCHEEA